MKRSYLTICIIVWFSSLVIAFTFGRSKAGSVAKVAEIEQKPIANRAIESKDATEDSALEETVELVEVSDASEALSAFFEGSAMTLAEAMAEIDRLSPSETRSFLDEAFALDSSDPRRARLITSLLRQLAASNPQEAYGLIANISSLRDSERAKVAVLEVWAKNDPVSALTWAQTALADEPRHLYSSQMRALYRGYAEMNPQAAFTAAQSLPATSRDEQRMRNQVMGEVIETQVQQGQVQQAQLAIELISDPDVREQMTRELVDEWAQFDPRSAAAYVDSLGEAATSRIKSSLAEEWSESDPAAAAAWLSSLGEDDQTVARAASDVIREWTRYDLTASAEWLNSLPASPDLDRAVASYTWSAAQEDPANAMSWAESISSDRIRDRLMQSVASSWKDADPDAFSDYLSSADLSEEQVESLQNAEGRGFGGGNRGGGRNGFGRR